MKTKESLSIFTSFTSREGTFQDEVDGLVFYGYWNNNVPSIYDIDFKKFRKCWSTSEITTNHRTSEVEGYAQLSIELRIHTWPDEGSWFVFLENSLKWFVRQGATVSWCGTEFSSSDLGSCLSDSSSGNIYAAYTDERGFVCEAGLTDEYQELSHETLKSFGRVRA